MSNEENKELDFSLLTLGRENDVCIEFPTKTDWGLILVSDDLMTTRMGWFKVVKVGSAVTRVKEGQEAFIYFYNQPIKFEEIHLAPRIEQKKEMEKEKAEFEKTQSKIIQVKPTWEGAPKEEFVKDRMFAVLNSHDVIWVRDFVNV